jgi:hypothetical protein
LDCSCFGPVHFHRHVVFELICPCARLCRSIVSAQGLTVEGLGFQVLRL